MINYDKENLTKIYPNNDSLVEFNSRIKKLEKQFINIYNTEPTDVFSSPGRIEIVGNHTDHNHGQVLVGAVDCDMLGVSSKADDISIMSDGFPEIKFDLNDIELKDNEKGTSKAIVKGIVKGFQDRNLNIGGFKMCMNSNIFKGAGVSSSAAYELLIAEVLNYYYNNDQIDRFILAQIGQFAENVYFGKPCGLLDQSGISFGGVVNIDFKNPNKPKVTPLGCSLNGYEVVIINTGDHTKLTNEYADIRLEMNKVAECFGKEVLSEVSEKDFFESINILRDKVSDRAILRAIHFFDENKRVQDAVEAIKENNPHEFIRAVDRSGLSSQTNLQNAYQEGNVEQGVPLALAIAKHNISNGACRVHGGGFAGTIIAFVRPDAKFAFADNMAKLFGENNVIIASIREFGSCHI